MAHLLSAVQRRFLSSRCKNDSESGVKGRDQDPVLFNVLKIGRSKSLKAAVLRTKSSTSFFRLRLSCVDSSQGGNHRSEHLASAAVAMVTGLRARPRRRTDSASGSPASSSRSPPEPESAPASLRPTEPELQGGQHHAQPLPLFSKLRYRSASRLTFLLRHYCFEGGEAKVGRVRRFDQVTGVWIRQDGQQVTVPSSLHHFFHLERRKRS